MVNNIYDIWLWKDDIKSIFLKALHSSNLLTNDLVVVKLMFTPRPILTFKQDFPGASGVDMHAVRVVVSDSGCFGMYRGITLTPARYWKRGYM